MLVIEDLVRVLIVGAGAVGQVYGRHLDLGGAQVAFFVRPQYAEACRRGFTMYRLRRRRVRTPERFETFDVMSELSDVASQRWDQVWLAIPTTALRGDWLAPFIDATADATVVAPQPGIWARRRVEALVPADRLISGYISMVSYFAPLEGEQVPEPGVAYWFPPLNANRFSGPAEPVRAAVETLRRGGCPARSHDDAVRLSALSSVQLLPQIVALQGAGWSLSALRRSPLLTTAVGAGREAMAAVAAELAVRPSFTKRLAGPRFFRLGWWIGPSLVPFDMQTYLEAHFTKLVDQTRFGMTQLIETARRHQLPADRLVELVGEVFGGWERSEEG